MLREIFTELPDVAAKLDDDASVIESIVDQKNEAKRNADEWEKEIAFDEYIGPRFFEKRLSLSSAGVRWRDQTFALDSITRIRWGGTVRQGTFFSETTYTVAIGDDKQIVTINPDKEIFEAFINKLWRAVGVRLMINLLQGLGADRRYRFGSVVIDDRGVELVKQGLFSSGAKLYGEWSQLTISSAEGSFWIRHKTDKKAYAALSYQEIDNIHVLEAAIRAYFKAPKNDRISSVVTT